jgi:integrase
LETRPARNIVVESVASYRPTINGFVSWCGKEMKRHVEDLAPCHAEDYMDSLTVSAATKINYFRRLRSFDKYCTMHFKTSFMAGLKALKPKHKDRPGFSEAQQKAILDGCLTLENAFEAQTFLYLMRYTGMAAGDAALFGDTDEMPGIVGDEVQYFRIKTQEDENRVLVKVPIPSWLLERLAVLKNRGLTEDGGKRYYFAHGRVINKHSVQQMWRNLLKPIFDAAGIKGTGKTTCPLHRFRHTFAKDMLTKWINGKDGRKYQIPLETVSLWLGHRSVATTRKHYSLTIQQRETAGSEMMREVYAQEAKKELAA